MKDINISCEGSQIVWLSELMKFFWSEQTRIGRRQNRHKSVRRAILKEVGVQLSRKRAGEGVGD